MIPGATSVLLDNAKRGPRRRPARNQNTDVAYKKARHFGGPSANQATRVRESYFSGTLIATN